jgi:hypothetical protein
MRFETQGMSAVITQVGLNAFPPHKQFGAILPPRGYFAAPNCKQNVSKMSALRDSIGRDS